MKDSHYNNVLYLTVLLQLNRTFSSIVAEYSHNLVFIINEAELCYFLTVPMIISKVTPCVRRGHKYSSTSKDDTATDKIVKTAVFKGKVM